jgi:hypothetical protein
MKKNIYILMPTVIEKYKKAKENSVRYSAPFLSLANKAFNVG